VVSKTTGQCSIHWGCATEAKKDLVEFAGSIASVQNKSNCKTGKALFFESVGNSLQLLLNKNVLIV
jgi:hypothetical protein